MSIQNQSLQTLQRPAYVLEERLLRQNLSIVAQIAAEAKVEFILAFKAFALWRTFPIFREYIHSTTASSLHEARLGCEVFGQPCHTYSPAYTSDEIDELARCSSHLTFNSLSQLERFGAHIRVAHPTVSLGLRVNPEYSEVETLLYNPCAPGTRFGVMADQLPSQLPEGVEGFHCHNHCESSAEAFVRSLAHFEARFGAWLPQLKWVNFGGGHLVTRKDYNRPLLIETLRAFRARYPHLHVIMEPGSAFAWQTGTLVAHVVDVVENAGIKTAILNVSFTCHMPDCLEMPYWPMVRGAKTISDEQEALQRMKDGQQHLYRLGGCSCLSGDWMGYWQFPTALQVGQTVIFEDMIHYTTVKTTRFNGIAHPDLVLQRLDGTFDTLRRFSFEDYRDAMD